MPQKNVNFTLTTVKIPNLTQCFFSFVLPAVIPFKASFKKDSAFEIVTVKENSLADNPRTSHGQFDKGW
jgi:hypothetical protein